MRLPSVLLLTYRSLVAVMFEYATLKYIILQCLHHYLCIYMLYSIITHSLSRQSGEAIVANKEPEGQKTFVEDILTLQKKLDNVLKSAFFSQVSKGLCICLLCVM